MDRATIAPTAPPLYPPVPVSRPLQLDLRVAAARRLLSEGRPAVDVAFACGFADQPHLTRVFKRAVGVTPGHYARAS